VGDAEAGSVSQRVAICGDRLSHQGGIHVVRLVAARTGAVRARSVRRSCARDGQLGPVAEDADRFGGQQVDGPLTAYAEAEVINEHALAETDGQTYAQLDRDDPRRETAVTASFLRASLFTSVVAFGIAVFAAGLGVLLILVGWALLRIERSLRAVAA
jgi:hypothetical protein